MRYDFIYLSPHPDDVIFSCGGTIACRHQKGERQLVVTLCSALPVLAESQWHQRIDEEVRALNIYGIDGFFAGFLDAPFRQPVYQNAHHLFASPVADDPMPKQVEQLVAALAKHNQGAILYAPLGVGRHVDHLIAFEAAQGTGQFHAVHFYEDFPYTVKAPGAIEARLDEIGIDLTAVVTDIREGFQKKIEAAGQYVGQISFLFGTFDAALMSMLEEAQRVLPGRLGERSWIRSN